MSSIIALPAAEQKLLPLIPIMMYAFLLMNETTFSRHHMQHLTQHISHDAQLLASCRAFVFLSRYSRRYLGNEEV